ncbi:MAG: nucleoside monophosphate kinase [Caldisericia bacterium]|nr:nucleoside monophosphate kinase [Caldisericia bacterium]
MISILIGPPGSGKTTQAKLLAKELNIPLIATGDLVRSAINDNYKNYKKIVDGGNLLPDNVVFEIIKDEIEKLDINRGFIIEGFPRTIGQAKIFDEYLKVNDTLIDFVFYLQISKEELLERIHKRKYTDKSGRPDDELEAFNKRIDIYFSDSYPLYEYYLKRNLLYEISASNSIEKVFSDILAVINFWKKEKE